jgi:hypothetical protein
LHVDEKADSDEELPPAFSSIKDSKSEYLALFSPLVLGICFGNSIFWSVLMMLNYCVKT